MSECRPTVLARSSNELLVRETKGRYVTLENVELREGRSPMAPKEFAGDVKYVHSSLKVALDTFNR